MKLLSVIKIFASLLGLLAFGVLPGYAQAEVDPDHFDSPSAEPFEKAHAGANRETAPLQYNGTFTLPYSVQCNGKRLAPGQYSASLDSDGKVGHLVLNCKGQATRIACVAHKPGENHQSDALIVEHDGKARKLSAIQVARVDFVLVPGPHQGDSIMGKARPVERLPLTMTLPKHAESSVNLAAPKPQ